VIAYQYKHFIIDIIDTTTILASSSTEIERLNLREEWLERPELRWVELTFLHHQVGELTAATGCLPVG
jgi:hypothetical protein